ncbi:MAG: cobalamin-dependent protein [Thermodesulfobacteriota bacterium]
MRRVLLLQLPLPQLNYSRQTGNVPLAAACLKLATIDLSDVQIDILPESAVTYLGGAALFDLVLRYQADIIGFSVYSWNLKRSLYFAGTLKEASQPRIIFGGPEITPDNQAAAVPCVDFRVYGEGEAALVRLLQDQEFRRRKSASLPADNFFRTSRSPYLEGWLEPEIENMVLLETTCPLYPEAGPYHY